MAAPLGDRNGANLSHLSKFRSFAVLKWKGDEVGCGVWMRGQAAHVSGEIGNGAMAARPVDPARRITADSFRLLMAKLGPRPVLVPQSEPVALEPATEAFLPPEPVAEASVTVEDLPPAVAPEAA